MKNENNKETAHLVEWSIMSKDAKCCMDCINWMDDKPHCGLGFKPRFYKPKDQNDKNWGFKRVCDYYEKDKLAYANRF